MLRRWPRFLHLKKESRSFTLLSPKQCLILHCFQGSPTYNLLSSFSSHQLLPLPYSISCVFKGIIFSWQVSTLSRFRYNMYSWKCKEVLLERPFSPVNPSSHLSVKTERKLLGQILFPGHKSSVFRLSACPKSSSRKEVAHPGRPQGSQSLLDQNRVPGLRICFVLPPFIYRNCKCIPKHNYSLMPIDFNVLEGLGFYY